MMSNQSDFYGPNKAFNTFISDNILDVDDIFVDPSDNYNMFGNKKDAKGYMKSKIYSLGKKNFDLSYTSYKDAKLAGNFANDKLMIVFSNEDCGHCKTFEKTIKLIKNLDLIDVGVVENSELLDYFKISGTPTIKFYDGKVFHDFTGNRNIMELYNKITKLKMQT